MSQDVPLLDERPFEDEEASHPRHAAPPMRMLRPTETREARVAHQPAREARAEEELEWVRKAASGDDAAFTSLYRTYVRYVSRIAQQVGGGRLDSADVVQSVFLVVSQSLPKLREPQLFRFWLRRIVVREVLTRAAAERRRALFSNALSLILPDRSNPLERDAVGDLERVLGRLSTEERIVWVLTEIHGHSLGEVADECDVSLATVKRRLKRAQEKLESYQERGK